MKIRTHGRAWTAALAAILLPMGILGLGARRHVPAEGGGESAAGAACAVPPGLVGTNPNLTKGQDAMASTQVDSPDALPLLDREVPARTELATFALG